MKIFLVATGLLFNGGTQPLGERIQPDWETCKKRERFANLQYNPFPDLYIQIVFECVKRGS